MLNPTTDSRSGSLAPASLSETAQKTQTPTEIAARRGCPARRVERKWGLYRSEFDELLRGTVPILRRTPHLASQLALEVTAQTTSETGPRVEPRDALQLTFQVASAEVLQIALQANLQVAMEFGSPIADRDAVEFAVGFAAQVTSKLTN